MADGLTTLPYQLPAGTSASDFINSISGGQYSLQPTSPYTQLFQGLAPFLGGIGNLATANLGMNTANQAAGMADPFSGERQAYQTALRGYMGANPVNPAQVTAGTNNALSMLTNLLQNPQSLTSMPGYQFGLGQALESVNRGAGASGLLNSGNRLVGLEDMGNRYAQGWQNQIFNQLLGNVGANINAANLGLGAQQQGYGELANLAGVNAGNPGLAGQLLNQGRQNELTGIGQGIGGLASGAGTALGALQRIIGSAGGSSAGSIPSVLSGLGGSGGMFNVGNFGDPFAAGAIPGDISSLFGPNIDPTAGLGLDTSSIFDVGNVGGGLDLASLFGG